MQSKLEKFNELPLELQIETAQNLSNHDLVHFAQASKYHLGWFKPVIDVRKTQKLLNHVVRGEHDAVKAMLKRDMSLIFKRGFVTDCSGRTFENISAFEYALWALDKHMWTAMIACIPQNEEGREVFAQLIAQYNKVDIIGVTYRLNRKVITEQHFDFNNTIIKALQTQVNLLNAQWNKNWEDINNHWRESVGGAQKRLPMHVVDEYCSNVSFYPVPQFRLKPESAKQFYNWINEKNEGWFCNDSNLAIQFAIYKGSGSCWGRAQSDGPRAVLRDLDAMTALCQVRTEDFINLKSQLQEQMTLDINHPVYPC